MHIDKDTYRISTFNRYKSKSPKTQIVLATSMRKSNYYITRLQHKEHGRTKKWNTYTIARDGVIYQHYDDSLYSDFLGIKEGDKQSISIVLENMGYLFKTPDNQYINWLNEVCDNESVIEMKLDGYSYWEKFTDEQMKCVVELCKKVCEKHNIPKVCVEFNHYHKDIAKFRGIVFRANYLDENTDKNPSFNIPKFNKMLKDGKGK